MLGGVRYRRFAVEDAVEQARERLGGRRDLALRAAVHETDDASADVDERRARVAGHARDRREEGIRQAR